MAPWHRVNWPLARQRLAQFKPIRELYLYQGMRTRTPKTIAKTIASATVIHEIWNKIFVYTVTSVWKGFLSSKMAQITNNLMKKRLRQVTFMGCPTLKFSHQKRAFPQTHVCKSSSPITKNPVPTLGHLDNTHMGSGFYPSALRLTIY